MDEKLTKAQAELLAEACQRGTIAVGHNPPAPHHMAERMVSRGLMETSDSYYYRPTEAGSALYKMAQRLAASR